MNTADFFEYVNWSWENRKTATCRHCRHSIYQLPASDRWVHDAGNRRGCNAASYDRDGTWDDSLDRKWSARP